jgi:hypothetical protein
MLAYNACSINWDFLCFACVYSNLKNKEAPPAAAHQKNTGGVREWTEN